MNKDDEWVAAATSDGATELPVNFLEVDTRNLPLPLLEVHHLRILRFDEGHSVPRQESEDFVVKVRLKL
ncbi:MAG: hypothetical protein U0990_07805 [Candidatus Nanopelagicales bacterium]|nr:hypothetical protein [Candidatus Nanopelagicales bacterium]